MRRLVARLIFAVLLAGPVLAQAQVTSQDTLAFTSASVRLREKPFATARALAVLPQGTAVVSTRAPRAGATSRLRGSRDTYSKSFSPPRRRRPRRRRGAATSILRGNGSRRPRARRTGSRPRGLQPTAETGRSASVEPAKGPARITAAWRSG